VNAPAAIAGDLVPVIETERLTLRGWRLDDAAPFARLYADAEASRYVGGPANAGDAWRLMAAEAGHWVLRGYGMWVVEEKGGAPFTGLCGLWEPGDWPELEVGWIFLPDFHGRGYATEAGRRVRDYAYGVLGATTLVSYIHPDNEPSKRVARRLGAACEETIELRGAPVEVFRHPGPQDIP
jgi:RimJ/RimL family protein N-acetyltransferase